MGPATGALLSRLPVQLRDRIHHHVRLFLVDELAGAGHGIGGEVRQPIPEQLALLVGDLRRVLDPAHQQPDRSGERCSRSPSDAGSFDFAIHSKASIEPERSAVCPPV